MGHDVYNSESAQGRHPNRAHRIAQKLQEGGAEGADEAVGEQAVAYRGHGMLAHSEADVSAQGRITLEISGALIKTDREKSDNRDYQVSVWSLNSTERST
jgi:hypothetical protein